MVEMGKDQEPARQFSSEKEYLKAYLEIVDK
jgi:hypothetical protein